MKILHTSDWHLGHQLYGYDRREEQLEMLRQMAEIVRTESPDVFLLCGDVFHVAQPSAEVQKMFVAALTELRSENPDMLIVVTAGNHDSGSRHEIFRIPWKSMGVEAIGTLRRDSPHSHIVEVPGKGYIVAVPYTSGRYIPDGFLQELLDEVKKRNVDGLPVVMMAHTTVQGASFQGHDDVWEFTVGGIEGIEPEKLGTGYDYLALGHIHHQQFVRGAAKRMRYSGSPLAVSFSEDYPHSVSIVEIDAHEDEPRVKTIEIVNPIPLVTLPIEGAADWPTAVGLLKDFPDDRPAYIRLNVEVEDFLPVGASEEAFAIARDKKCRFCGINHHRKREAAFREKALSVQEFKETPPIEIARQFFEEDGGRFDEDLADMFNEVMKSL